MATATIQPAPSPFANAFPGSPQVKSQPFQNQFATPPAQGGFYGGVNPQNYFGSIQPPGFRQQMQQQGPFQRQNAFDPYGAGAYGLPDAFAGWTGPARNAEVSAIAYSQQAQGAQDLYRTQMNTDWSKQFVNQAQDIYGAAEASARRQSQQNLVRAGYGGGGTVSPFGAAQIEQESLARAGQLGAAARAGVIQGQQMKAESARNYLNSIAQNLQAFLTPAQLEVSRQARVPSTSGVNYIGPAIGAAGSIIGGAIEHN